MTNNELSYSSVKNYLSGHPRHTHTMGPQCAHCANANLKMCNTSWNPDRNKLFTTLKGTLTTITQKHQLHSCFFMMFWLGLASSRSNSPYPEIEAKVEQPLRKLIQSQTHLGWVQMYYRRMSKEWVIAVNTLHPHLPIPSEQIMTILLKTIWAYFHDIWRLRNMHLHNTAGQLDLPNYQQAIKTLYKQKHKLSPAVQAALYRQPLQEILDQPAPKMQQWVTRGYQYFTQQLKAECKQATLHTPDIHTFFQPLAQHRHQEITL